MICQTFKYANTVRIRNLLFASVAIYLGIFVSACLRLGEHSPAKDKHSATEHAWSVELREAEYKTVQHPKKKYFATILPDGLRVSFHTAQGHFGSYTFPVKSFPLGEPTFLLCPGSPELLPMRVVLIKGANNDLNDYHDYKIEWLDKSPATSGGTLIVRSY
ncbi:MAG: hypothetical protein AABN95_26975 [Acidobacteriota bacterium]